MESQNAIFDGLEMELRPIHDFYFNTPSFRDVRQSGSQREWNYFINAINRQELDSGRILRSIRDTYIHKIQALLHPDLDKTVCPYSDTEREVILRERRMVLQDCLDCLRTTKQVMNTLLDVPGDTYQENRPVSIVEFSDEHIPAIKILEEQTYNDAINGTKFAEMFKLMRDKNKLYDKHNKAHPMHFRVAVHPSKNRLVYGYIFTESSTTSACDMHTYTSFRGSFAEARRLTKIITMACQPEATARAVPELIADTLDHMQKRQGDRFEDHTKQYHQEG